MGYSQGIKRWKSDCKKKIGLACIKELEMNEKSDRNQHLSRKFVKCAGCGKLVSVDEVKHCICCGEPLCDECWNSGFCSTCYELWEAEIDLEDM